MNTTTKLCKKANTKNKKIYTHLIHTVHKPPNLHTQSQDYVLQGGGGLGYKYHTFNIPDVPKVALPSQVLVDKNKYSFTHYTDKVRKPVHFLHLFILFES